MKILTALVSIFVMFEAVAVPFSWSNFYISGFGGVNFVNCPKIKHGRINMENGYAVGSSLGYRLFRLFSVEAEAAYRENDYKSLAVKYERQEKTFYFKTSGKHSKVTAMANCFFNMPLNFTFIPYLGFGIGGYWEQMRIKPINIDGTTFLLDTLDIHNHNFAHQSIVGIKLCGVSIVKLSAEYRYLNGVNMEVNHTINAKLQFLF